MSSEIQHINIQEYLIDDGLPKDIYPLTDEELEDLESEMNYEQKELIEWGKTHVI